MEKPTKEGSVSSFGALMVSTASRVGTGNIIGVSTAICIGGYGGPAYYIQAVLKKRWIGVLFCVFLILTYAVGYNLLASYNLQSTFIAFSFYGPKTPFLIGAIFGGFSSSALMYGIKRGLYSNEAGMGSATALMCLCSGVAPTEALAGAPYAQASLQQALSDFGPVFIAISMALFAFTTLLGNYYYCEGCIKYILKRSPSHRFMVLFQLLAAFIVFLGATVNMELAWNTADLLMAILVLINMPVILKLHNIAINALNDYNRQRKTGANPVFHASDIGLKEKVDFWN